MVEAGPGGEQVLSAYPADLVLEDEGSLIGVFCPAEARGLAEDEAEFGVGDDLRDLVLGVGDEGALKRGGFLGGFAYNLMLQLEVGDVEQVLLLPKLWVP